MGPHPKLAVTWEEPEDVVSSISKAVLCYVSIVGVAYFFEERKCSHSVQEGYVQAIKKLGNNVQMTCKWRPKGQQCQLLSYRRSNSKTERAREFGKNVHRDREVSNASRSVVRDALEYSPRRK